MRKRFSPSTFGREATTPLRCVASMALILAAACSAAPPTSLLSVRPERHAERVISLSPNVSEIIAGLGAFQRVVAVCRFCDYPPEVKARALLGGWENPKLEQVMALHPNLVIITEAQAPLIQNQLQMLGIQTLVMPSQSVEHAFTAIKRIGDALGYAAQAQSLIAQTRGTLDEIRFRTKL